MSKIDWSKAPEWANRIVSGCDTKMWYWACDSKRQCIGGLPVVIDSDSHVTDCWDVVTWKPEREYKDDLQPFTSVEDAQPKHEPYTRDEALRFLVERLDIWPTDISSAPTCPGWGWVFNGNHPEFEETDLEHSVAPWPFIGIDEWQVSRPDFVPFVSVEDAKPAPDMVNHPPHYQSDNGIECIDAIRSALGRDGFIAYCIGNSMKYQWREKADKLEDMRKAAWYLNRAIEEKSK